MQPIGKTSPYINLREVSLRVDLLPGVYCIVPTTFRPGEEGQFLVRTFVERDWVTRSGDVVEEEEEIEEALEDDKEKDEENEKIGSQQWEKAAHNGEQDEENETGGSHPKMSSRRSTR